MWHEGITKYKKGRCARINSWNGEMQENHK
jgi:hypothetical protein